MSDEDKQAVFFLVCIAVLIPLGTWLCDLPVKRVIGTELVALGVLGSLRFFFS